MLKSLYDCVLLLSALYLPAILSKAKDYTLSWIANDGDSAGSYPSATEGDGGGGPGWSTGSSTPTELLYTDQSIGQLHPVRLIKN